MKNCLKFDKSRKKEKILWIRLKIARSFQSACVCQSSRYNLVRTNCNKTVSFPSAPVLPAIHFQRRFSSFSCQVTPRESINWVRRERFSRKRACSEARISAWKCSWAQHMQNRVTVPVGKHTEIERIRQTVKNSFSKPEEIPISLSLCLDFNSR